MKLQICRSRFSLAAAGMVLLCFFIPTVWQGYTKHSSFFKTYGMAVKLETPSPTMTAVDPLPCRNRVYRPIEAPFRTTRIFLNLSQSVDRSLKTAGRRAGRGARQRENRPGGRIRGAILLPREDQSREHPQ